MTLHQRFDLIADAPADRRAALRSQLRAAGCAVAYDDALGRLDLTVDAGEGSWMRTGRVTSLLLAFDDVVRWQPEAWRPHLAPPAAPPTAPLVVGA